MKPLLVLALFICSSKISYGQDSLLTYSKVLKVDSLNKNQIYYKTLIWCSRSFTDSKCATNVKEREGGIIGGKAVLYSAYKVY